MSKAWADHIERRIRKNCELLIDALMQARAKDLQELRDLRTAVAALSAGQQRIGLPGAYPCEGAWVSACRIDGQVVYLGTYKTERDAHMHSEAKLLEVKLQRKRLAAGRQQ